MNQKNITLNKGEWAEYYVQFKAVAEGKFVLCDADLLPQDDFINIMGGKIQTHAYTLNDTHFLMNDVEIKKNDFSNYADIIFNKIISHQKSSFAISEIDSFLHQLNLDKVLKGDSYKKGDIELKIAYQNILDNFLFTIKSFFSSNPTLVNASRHTNFIFKIKGSIPHEWENLKSKGLVKNIPVEKLIFEKIESETYDKNLRLIDLQMPEILSYGLLEFFSSPKRKINEIVDILIEKNPLKIAYPDIYIDKFKDFLFYSAVGIFPSKQWDGRQDIDGGAIIVKKTGDIVTFFIVKKQSLVYFREYLYKTAFFEVASPTRHGFGKIYYENNHPYLKLNLQIRLHTPL